LYQSFPPIPYPAPIPADAPARIGPRIEGLEGAFCLIGLIVWNEAVGATKADVVILFLALVSAAYWSKSMPYLSIP